MFYIVGFYAIFSYKFCLVSTLKHQKWFFFFFFNSTLVFKNLSFSNLLLHQFSELFQTTGSLWSDFISELTPAKWARSISPLLQKRRAGIERELEARGRTAREAVSHQRAVDVCLQEWIDAPTGAPLCSHTALRCWACVTWLLKGFCLLTRVFVCHFVLLIVYPAVAFICLISFIYLFIHILDLLCFSSMILASRCFD